MGLFHGFEYILFSISLIFSLATLFLFKIYSKKLSLVGGWYSYTLPFFVLQIFTLTYLGSFIAFFMKSSFLRLEQVSYESISIFMAAISYSIFVLFFVFILYVDLSWKKKIGTGYTNKNIKSLFNKSRMLTDLQLVFIFLLLFVYIAYKYFSFYYQSPLYFLISGEVLKAAEARYLIQTGINSVDIKYVSKVIEILGFYLVLYTFILYKIKGNKYYLYSFLLSLALVCSNLIFDAQKAPLVIIFSCLFFVSVSIQRKFTSVIIFILLILSSIIFVSYISSDNESFNFDIIISVLDRAFIGQNQGMYYIFDYLNVTYNDIIEWLTSDNYTPADQLVVSHMDFYAGNPNIVNVNTYYLGEAWFSFGWVGLLLAPIIVSFVFILFLASFDYLLSKNFSLYFPLALYTASTIPLSRSFYQMISLKFLIYVVLFGVVPLFFIDKLRLNTNKKKQSTQSK
jgi:hypothetical protein